MPAVDQLLDPLAGGQPALFVLPLDGRLAAAEANIGFLLGELSEEIGERCLVSVRHRRGESG